MAIDDDAVHSPKLDRAFNPSYADLRAQTDKAAEWFRAKRLWVVAGGRDKDGEVAEFVAVTGGDRFERPGGFQASIDWSEFEARNAREAGRPSKGWVPYSILDRQAVDASTPRGFFEAVLALQSRLAAALGEVTLSDPVSVPDRRWPTVKSLVVRLRESDPESPAHREARRDELESLSRLVDDAVSDAEDRGVSDPVKLERLEAWEDAVATATRAIGEGGFAEAIEALLDLFPGKAD